KAWEAKLEEPSVFNPPKAQTPAYHGLSATGNVTGPLIYVNFCHKADFKRLWDSQVDPDLAMKVRAAQNAGVAGVLVYSDPAEDGFKKGNPWPDGKWRPGDSVQRGSVAQSNLIIGDGQEPGVTEDPQFTPLLEGRAETPQFSPWIRRKLPDEWVGGVPDVGDGWYSGHLDTSPKVLLQNDQDEVEQQRITNVFGSLKGSEDPGRKIIVGNHRDSWCFGAGDPGSGTAVMLEVARVLGELRSQGWRPLRTIEFASWDAGEYNRIGSTEHVEANVEALRESAIAYLNVDVGVTGDKLWANGSPIFQHAWTRVLDRLNDPRQNKTLKELWETSDSKLGNLGAGSDYVAFQTIAAPRPSTWLHQLNRRPRLEPIMPLKLDDYARALQEEGQQMLDWTEKVSGGGEYNIEIFQPLVDSLSMFKKKAEAFGRWEQSWYNQVYATGGFESSGVTMQRIMHNGKIASFESDLLDLVRGKDDGGVHGLPDRQQFKHVIFAPDINNGLESSVFPFARDAIEKKDWDAAAKGIKKTADILTWAAERLGG
ncbi:N-acetylated-alpha-linked acidic dipeptidase 2, partial [Pyrenophora tritici-repentis]